MHHSSFTLEGTYAILHLSMLAFSPNLVLVNVYSPFIPVYRLPHLTMLTKDTQNHLSKATHPANPHGSSTYTTASQSSTTSYGLQRLLDEKLNETPWSPLKQGQRHSSVESETYERGKGKVSWSSPVNCTTLLTIHRLVSENLRTHHRSQPCFHVF